MSRSRSAAVCARRLSTAALCALVLLAGCTGGEPVPPAPSPAAPSSPYTAPGRLDAGQARAALLTVQDLPAGWSADPDEPADDDRPAYRPKACSVFGTGQDTLARTSFSQGGDRASALTQQIYRPAAAVPQHLGDLRELVGTCATYSVEASSGKTTIKLSPGSFPALGDGTVAVRAVVNGAFVGVVDDIVFVAAGPQVVRFDAISTGTGLSAGDYEKVVRAALARL